MPPLGGEDVDTLLDYMRRELTIKVDYLDEVWQERLRQNSSQRLRPPCALDEQAETWLMFGPLAP